MKKINIIVMVISVVMHYNISFANANLLNYQNYFTEPVQLNYNSGIGNDVDSQFVKKTDIFSYILSILKQSTSKLYKIVNDLDLFDFLREQYQTTANNEPKKEYDFIVVGAGSAGSVVASRLSEEGKWSVLLLEAGKTESLITDIPIAAGFLLNTDYNWGYSMEPQSTICQGMIERRCPLYRGKTVGGSSVINLMAYTRGNRKDWDQIEADGNAGWSYDEVKPYFQKSEKAKLKGLTNSPNHNKNGLLHVEYGYKTQLSKLFLDAGKELGYNITDYNSENQIGFAYLQTTTRNGRRNSVARAFLSPFKNRSNLNILSRSRVTKINIDRKTKTAKSVEFVRNRIMHRVRARKEIILSAGTFITPQLLMLSGIGPKAHLKELGIELIQELNVGENLHDHLLLPSLGFLINRTGLGITEKSIGIDDVTNWISNGKGPLAFCGLEAISFIKSKLAEDNYPDIEIQFSGGSHFSDSSGAFSKASRFDPEFYNSVFGDVIGKDSISFSPMITYTKSKGYIRLKDRNPFHWPKFFYNVDPSDLKIMMRAIEFIMKIIKTKAFAEYGVSLAGNPIPNCAKYQIDSEDYWLCAMSYLIIPAQHHMGTCKMGIATDPLAVVDNTLKVYGIKRLRVADLSIVPKQISSHTNAVAIMIGERVSDFIKDSY